MSLPEVCGHGRYRLRRRLGVGGMGVVYQADDLERGQAVALKSLEDTKPETLYRLKREFRALAGITHPNLVHLYDLWIDGDECFYTMELVHGIDFIAHCAANTATSPEAGLEATLEVPSAGLACNERKLRAALRQLAGGVAALHAAGKLHRDLKPSNVLVDRDGRVVILDFGLVTDLSRRSRQSMLGQIVGTAEYMAPEQAGSDEALTPAADWYAVGAMVYEALTGRLPFTGSVVETLREKIRRAPPPPRAIVPQVPEDLDELCVDLLARDPARRPIGAEVLRRVGVSVGGDDRPAQRSGRITEHAAFAGRVEELAVLDGALARVERGQAAVVIVRGPSGIGKTELVRAFLERAHARRPDLVALEGRCYRGEAVPYKAMDALIDHLSRVWSQLPDSEAGALVPRWSNLLQKLFPVLGRVPALVDARGRKPPADAQERRTRAFNALREVLQRLGDRRPLVLFLDDMQWVDTDTVTLLADLMRPPDAPALLLVLASRETVAGGDGQEDPFGSSIPGYPSFDAAGSPREATLLDQLTREIGAPVERIDLEPLGDAESMDLATRLLGSHAERYAVGVVAEAGGNPFFLGELAQYVKTVEPGDVDLVSLDDAVGHRIGQSSEESRRLLEVICVAGEPLSRRVAGSAVRLEGAALTRELRLLGAGQLIRVAGDDDRVEPYHNRIREAVLAGLAPRARAQHHRALAVAYERWDEGSAEQLARHWFGAGAPDRAGEFARRAADEAAALLDFDRAARFYQMVLTVGAGGESQERELLVRLGDAQADAGRPLEAANAYLAAAKGGDTVQRLELRRLAAQQLLSGGYQRQGLEVISGVLAEIGLKMPRTPRRALASLLWRRARLRMRGLDFTRREANQIAPELLTKIDACWSVGQGLMVVDNIRGADYQARHLLLALGAGEPTRVARAYALEAALYATQASPRAHDLVDRAQALLDPDEPDAQAAGTTEAARAAIAYFATSRWQEARDRFAEAARILRANQVHTGWELVTSLIYECFSRAYLGELAVLARLVPAHVREAERRGDLYARANFLTRLSIVQLAADDPDAADDSVERALDEWAATAPGFQVQHWFAFHDRVQAALYRGDVDAAAERFDRDVKRLERSQLLRVHLVAIEAEFLRARIALQRKDARAARASARAMARRRPPIGRAIAQLVRACAARLDGDEDRAVAMLRAALDQLEELDTGLLTPPVRRQLGRARGGGEGDELAALGEQQLRAQGVVDVDRFSALFVPGW